MSDQNKPTLPAYRDVELREVGIDYLTLTSRHDEGKMAALKAFNKYGAQLRALGDKEKKTGFQGFAGASVGPLMYGRRDDEWLLRVSGSLANEIFALIPWGACHCSRIDLQVTVCLPEDRPLLALEAAEWRAGQQGRGGAPLRPRQSLYMGYGEGDTLRIGSRVSPRYGRVYDKWRESGDERYKNCWRFEVEYKKLMAPKIVEYLLQESDRTAAIGQVVKGQFEEWGIECPIGFAGHMVPGSVGRREFASDRSVRWLETQVKPSIERLLATVDRADILQMLGLEAGPEDVPLSNAAWARKRMS
jgi:hypothetical protein